MSLVAYASSDESDSGDNEESDNIIKTNVTPNVNYEDLSKRQNTPIEPALQKTETEARGSEIEFISKNESIFSNLPAPKQSNAVKMGNDSLLSNSAPQNVSVVAGLPPPKRVVGNFEVTEDDELEDLVKPSARAKSLPNLPKPPKKREPVKIAVPALPKDDSDEDEPDKKRQKPNKKSGLFNLLPPPKHAVKKEVNRSLIPHTLKKNTAVKASPAVTSANRASHDLPSNTPSSLKPAVAYDSSDDEEEGRDSQSNFFSLSSDDISTSASIDQNWKGPSVRAAPWSSRGDGDLHVESDFVSSSDLKTGPISSDADFGQTDLADSPLVFKSGATSQMNYHPDQVSYNDNPYNEYAADNTEPVTGDYQMAERSQQLEQDELFLRMQGKKFRGKEAINIIDINADDQTCDVDLSKTLSEEKDNRSHSRKKGNMPSSQQRRKHQITYLAFQAKEKELELKNQWADNRLTKRQTQAKYGF